MIILTNYKLKFNGSCGEFFICSIGLFVISIVTLGIFIPVLIFYLIQFIINGIEIQEKDSGNSNKKLQ